MNPYVLDVFADTVMPAFAFISGILLRIHFHRPFGWILIYLAISSLVFGFSNYLADRNFNNLFIYNSFGVVENIFIGLFIIASLTGKRSKGLVSIIISFNLLIFLIKACFDSSYLEKYSSLIMLSTALGQLMCVIFFAFKIFQAELLSDLEFQVFWTVGAIYVFHIGALALEFGYWRFSGQGNESTKYIWYSYDILLILKFAIILYSFFKIKYLLNSGLIEQ